MVVCIALLALLSLMLIPHVHQAASETDHCALCMTMHAAITFTAAIFLILLCQLGVSAPVLQTAGIFRPWHAQLFIRPPPQAR